MFVLDLPPVSYVEPWGAPYRERLAALARGRLRVAYFYTRPDSSTFRYRVHNMIEILNRSEQPISAAYFCNADLDRMSEVVALADVLVICRAPYTAELNEIITRSRGLGKRVYFDLDDHVFDSEYVHPLLHAMGEDLGDARIWDHWFAYTARIAATMRLCERVITTNELLAARIRDHTGGPVTVIRNFLNPRQLEISRQIYARKVQRGFRRDGRIHLGYFSGTASHDRDLDLISDALAGLLDADPRVVLVLAGRVDPRGRLRGYRSRIRYHKMQDFVNLQRLIGAVEVNLVPLRDNVFTSCKSELKYFEAGITGTLSIASPAFAYRQAIRDGDNGYLARSFEWRDKLEHLLASLEDYPRMAQRAFEDCERRYAGQDLAGELERVFGRCGA